MGIDQGDASNIGRAIGDAIASALGSTSTSLDRACDKRGIAAFERIERTWRDDRQRMSNMVTASAGACCDRVLAVVLDHLRVDPRMPREVNYLARYAAFKGIDDREQLLRRIDQTIEAAERIADSIDVFDPVGALADAAAAYRQGVSRIGSVCVSPAAGERGVEAEAVEDVAEPLIPDDLSAAYRALFDRLGENFAQAVPQASGALENRLEADRTLDELDRRIESATKSANDDMRARLAEAARLVEGRSIEVDDLPLFTSTACIGDRFSPVEAQELAREVRASFATYCSCVRDNGVFSAFSEGSDFGRCSGWSDDLSYWDDDLMDVAGGGSFGYTGSLPRSRGAAKGIPSTVVEDAVPDGDSPARAIERMRAFNKRRYFGLLDDDFMEHVDAFWYGFRKLMEFANGIAHVDVGSFSSYCSDVRSIVVKRVSGLALLMNEAQVEAYCNDVDALARG